MYAFKLGTNYAQFNDALTTLFPVPILDDATLFPSIEDAILAIEMHRVNSGSMSMIDALVEVTVTETQVFV